MFADVCCVFVCLSRRERERDNVLKPTTLIICNNFVRVSGNRKAWRSLADKKRG